MSENEKPDNSQDQTSADTDEMSDRLSVKNLPGEAGRMFGCLIKGILLVPVAIIALILINTGLGYVIYPFSYWLHDVNFPGVHESPGHLHAGMQWVDDERIVFATLPPERERSEPADIILWTVPEDGPDTIETLVQGQARSISAWTFCYKDGGLVFTLHDDGESAAWMASFEDGAPPFEAENYPKSYRRLARTVGPDGAERWSIEPVERQVGDDLYCTEGDDPDYIDTVTNKVDIQDIRPALNNSRRTNVGLFVDHGRGLGEWTTLDLLVIPAIFRSYFIRMSGGYIITQVKFKSQNDRAVLTGDPVRLTDRDISYPIVSPNGCRLAVLEDERRYLSNSDGTQNDLDYNLRVYDLCKHRDFFE